jgi:hypothetical protein
LLSLSIGATALLLLLLFGISWAGVSKSAAWPTR